MAALVVIAVGPAQTLAQMPEASVAAKITIVAIEVAGAILLAAMFSRRLKQAPNAQKRPPQDAGPTT